MRCDSYLVTHFAGIGSEIIRHEGRTFDMNAALPPDEDKRLDALRQYQILDTLPEQEFDDLTHLAMQISGASMAAVVLIDHDRQWFKAKAGFDASETPRELGFCTHAILEHDIVVVPDATADRRFADHPHVMGEPHLRFYVGMPLTTPEGYNVGTLCAFDTTPRQLTTEQQDALRRLGRQVVAHLEARPNALDGAKADEKPTRQERLHSEDVLKESEARFRRLFESAQDGILILDADSGEIEEVNPYLTQLLSYPAEHFLGKQLWQIGIFQDIEANKAVLRSLQETGFIRYEDLPLETQSGNAVSVEFVSNLYAVGAKKVIQCNIRDISARKKAEEALSDSEARFRFLTNLGDKTRTLSDPAEIMATAATLLGLHLRVSRCAYAEVEAGGDAFTIPYDYTDNCASTAGDYHLSLFGPRACAELRANRTLVVSDVDAELTPETGADMFNAIGIKAIICCPLVKNGELRAMMAVHQIAPRQWTASEIALVEEVVERCWSIIERARAELVLRKTEESRLMAVEAGGVGDWEFDPATTQIRWSDRARELMGFERANGSFEVENSYQQVLKTIHANDRERFEVTVAQALNPAGDGHFRLEFRVVGAEGKLLWLDARGRAKFDEVKGERRAIQLLGTMVDITERKRTEEALREGTERMDFVIELAGLGEWELNLLNKSASRSLRHDQIFGYQTAAPDWTYDKFLEHILPEDRDGVDAKFQAAVQFGLVWDFEAQIRRTDEQVRVIWARGRIWRDESGQPTRMLGTVADITERKRTEEERERFLAVGTELLGIAGFDSRFKWVSPAWQRLFGWSVAEFTSHPWLHFVHPEDHASTVKEAQRLFESEETISFENRYRTHDGDYRWISWNVKPYPSEQLFFASATDITERKHNAEALLERTRLAELNADIGQALTQSDTLEDMLHCCAETMVQHLDASFARIWTLNPDTNILELQASAGLYTHLDGPHSRVPVGQFKIGLIAQERQPHLTNAVVGDPRVSDQEWARREGMVAFAGYPLLVEDQIIGVIALFARHCLSEATIQVLAAVADSVALGIERKQGEQKRAILLESEQQARQEAESTNRIKDEFLATLSHELRTPLNAILGWAHMLRAGQLDESDTVRALETIERNARAQVQLIEDLLDVSRIITGKLRLEVRPLELAEIIQAAVDTVRPAADAKSIRIQMLLDPHAGPVSGDSDRLQQVVWNLLTNAVKFTPKGGRVQVRLERVNSHVEIAVSDTGQGIDAEFLPHIFDRFRQADQTSTRAYGGLGLGLSIVHHLVDLHGGTIDVQSAGKEQGSTFVLHLPCMAVIHNAETLERRHPTAGSTHAINNKDFGCPPQLSDLRVLIVDDEPDTRDLLRTVLEGCDSVVMVAASVIEAFEVFTDWKPDVLVSDIGMPQEDGYSLIRKVRAWEQQHGGRVPAIALTAYARVEDRVHVLQAGFQVHVPKPIEPAELLAVVASLAGRTGGA